MRYIVYMHINKVNGKKYIGITSQTSNKRWANGKGYKQCPLFYNAIKKYSFDGFEHIIVADGLTEQEAKQMEIDLIAKHKTQNIEYGYNLTSGGDGATGRECSCATKLKLSYYASTRHADVSNEKNPMHGKKQSKESNEKNMLSQKTRKEVEKIDIETGEVVAIFPSQSSAARSIGASTTAIGYACKGIVNSVGGFKWQYVNEPHEFVSKNTKIVQQIDIDTNEVLMEYTNANIAAKSVGGNKSNITKVCLGKKKTAYGYGWRYKDD